MAKSLPTHVTSVRSLSSMNSLMLNKSYVISESLPTINTIKGFLSSMIISPMTDKRSILPEGLPTVNAFIGSFPSMDPSMMS